MNKPAISFFGGLLAEMWVKSGFASFLRLDSRYNVVIILSSLVNWPQAKSWESALATQMGVSRSPVREALYRLQREGLVQSQTSRDSYVWEPTEADVDEIMSLRVMIEFLVVEWAIPNLSDGFRPA